MTNTATAKDDSSLALTRACSALWVATMALMTAFMQTAAPAHRYLIARRIARNLHTLREQECFTQECRAIFTRLAGHWNEKADALAPEQDRPRGGVGLLPAWLKTSR